MRRVHRCRLLVGPAHAVPDLALPSVLLTLKKVIRLASSMGQQTEKERESESVRFSRSESTLIGNDCGFRCYQWARLLANN